MLLEQTGDDAAAGKKITGFDLFFIEQFLYENDLFIDLRQECSFVADIGDYLIAEVAAVFHI